MHRRFALQDISVRNSQTRPTGRTVRRQTAPMVVVHITPPPEPSVLGVSSSSESPPRRPKRGYKWVTDTPPSSVERSKSLSPVKSPPLIEFVSPGVRRSPRKRLVYFSNEKPNDPPTPKKVKFEFSPRQSPPFRARLHALSPTQLINMISNIVHEHSHLQSEITRMIPKPDLKPVQEHMKYFRICIHKALPRHSSSRLKSKTDAVAFGRTETHVYALKQYIFETGVKLVKSQYWDVVADFTIMAWNTVRITPVWDTPIHNETRDACYQYLSKLLERAIREGNFPVNDLRQIQKQTCLLEKDSTCFAELNASLKNVLTKKDGSGR